MKGLKILRIKNDLTQQQLADKTGFHVRQICSWEQGRREPKIDSLKKLAAFFKCSIDELL